MKTKRDKYESELKKKQKEHLAKIANRKHDEWIPCAHDACTSCFGTGIKVDGTFCVHMISCPCQKCTPHCLSYKSKVSSIYEDLKKRVEVPFRHTKIIDFDNVESVFNKHINH